MDLRERVARAIYDAATRHSSSPEVQKRWAWERATDLHGKYLAIAAAALAAIEASGTHSPTTPPARRTKMSEDRPTGRELRLVNAAIDLVTFLDPEWLPHGVSLTDPALMKLHEIREVLGLYKAHMLNPDMERHTQIPVQIVRFHE